jgi:hypothetical protein
MIRSLTIGLPLGLRAPAEIATQVRDFVNAARSILAEPDLMPRTIRFTLPAAGRSGEIDGAILASLRWVDELASANDVRWYCLPLDFIAADPRRIRLSAALDAIGRFSRLFLNTMIADGGKIAVAATNDVADLILKIARKSNNGFDNFRVGASCNCPANTPFFPFSRHEGDAVAFSFALETTPIALNVVEDGTDDLAHIRNKLTSALESFLRKLDAIGHALAKISGVEYRGLDASLAPFPDGKTSVGRLVEQILGAPPGSPGGVLVTALLTDSIRAALTASGAKAVGFNGVMYSLLEDQQLAKANSRRAISIDGLISLAAVCGCGIDMVPIAGTTFPEEIAALMLDIAGLSSTLKKPLGIRLLPIPNRGVNELTQFNLDFLCDSRIIGLAPHDRSFKTEEHLLDFRSPIR